VHERLLAQNRVFRQHPVEIGAKPVGQVFRPDGATKPARVETARDPVADFDPCYAVADRSDFAGAIGERYHAELGRAAATALQDHQVAVVERARAHPHQHLPQPGSWVIA